MLINCPKCGFSQPKDRYCASCGVDMENYRPSPPSVASKIMGNPILHVALIFILVCGAVIFIQQQKKVEIRQRAEFLKGGPVVVQRSDSSMVEDSNPNQPSQSIESTGPAQEETASARTAIPSPQPTANNDRVFRAAINKSFENTIPNENLAPRAGKVTAYYIEMEKPALRQLILDAQATGQFTQFGESSTGTVPEIDQKLVRMAGSTIHHRLEIPITANEQTWHVGISPEAAGANPTIPNYGLTTSIAFNDFNSTNVRGEVEVRRILPEGDAVNVQNVTRSFPAGFDLAPRAGLMISGFIPHKIVNEVIEKLKPDNFFKIYNSKNFENGQTEFVMLFKFDPPRAGANNPEPATN